jgi:hypothetical protein
VNLSSSTLRKAADIQERIEKLQNDLDQLLRVGELPATTEPVAPSRAAATPRTQARRVSTTVTRRARGRRSTSPTGPLAPAVVKVLKSKGSPMSVADILDGLTANGYRFASPEPKKNLFARIYRLKGVKQVGPGRFAAE